MISTFEQRSTSGENANQQQDARRIRRLFLAASQVAAAFNNWLLAGRADREHAKAVDGWGIPFNKSPHENFALFLWWDGAWAGWCKPSGGVATHALNEAPDGAFFYAFKHVIHPNLNEGRKQANERN